MKNYEITLYRHQSATVIVSANSEEEAKNKVDALHITCWGTDGDEACDIYQLDEDDDGEFDD